MLVVEQAGRHLGIVYVLRVAAKTVQQAKVFAGSVHDLLNAWVLEQRVKRGQVESGQSVNDIAGTGCGHLYHAKRYAITVAVVVKFNVEAEGIKASQFLHAGLQRVRLVDELNRGQGLAQMVSLLAGKNKGKAVLWHLVVFRFHAEIT